jgi:hypothetical protein
MVAADLIVFVIFMFLLGGGAEFTKRVLANRAARRKEMLQKIENALLTNDRFRIENTLIVYRDQIDKKTVRLLEGRVNDLIVSEDIERVDRNVKPRRR